MAAEAIPGAPSSSEALPEPTTSATMLADTADAKSASNSTQKRPQTTAEEAKSTHPKATPEANGAAETKNDAQAQHAGGRLSSHLDMLAETVRAIVTRVMQPESVLSGASGDEGEDGEGEGIGAVDEGLGDGQQHSQAADAEAAGAAPRSEYSVETRQLCVDKHAAGQSYKAIAEELKMPVTTVQTIVKRAKQQGGAVVTAARAGRPRVTNEGVEATIRELVAQNPSWTAREVLDKVLASHEGVAVSFETIRRRVRDCKKQLSIEAIAASKAVVPLNVSVNNGTEDEEKDTEETLDTSGDSHEVDEEGEEDEEVAETTSTEESVVPAGKAKGKARRKRGSEYTPEVRELCVVKHEQEGKSYHAIAEELDIPPDSVRAIVRKAKKTGTVESAPRSGRPRKTTGLIDRVILQSVKNSERSTAKQIQDDLRTIYQVKVSVETIRRRVRDHTKQRLQLVDTTAAQAAGVSGSEPTGAVDTVTPSEPKQSKRPLDNAQTAGEGDAVPGEPSKKRKRAEYSVETRERCVELHRQGLGYRKIGDQLDMPHTTVRAIVEKVLRTGSALPAPRSGRPRKTDEILDKVILQTVKMNSKCSARMIQQELESGFDVKVSCETIRRRVKDYMRQKHLFADFVESSTGSEGVNAAAMGTSGAVDDQAARTVTDFQLQQSMFGFAGSDLQEQHEQAFVPIQHGSSGDSSLRGVPQSLMEMMTAAAAAAAVVTSHQQHQAAQQQAQQQALALLPMNFIGSSHAFGLHSHSMQTMLHQAMDSGGSGGGMGSQPPQPLSPTPLNDFVL